MKINFKTINGQSWEAKIYQGFDSSLGIKTLETLPETLTQKLSDIFGVRLNECKGVTQIIAVDIAVMKNNYYYGIVNYRIGEGASDHKQHRFSGQLEITEAEETFINENLK